MADYFDPTVGRYRGAGGRFLSFPSMTKLVCASCGKAWRGSGSPARCLDCGKTSYPISVSRKKASDGASKGKSNSRGA